MTDEAKVPGGVDTVPEKQTVQTPQEPRTEPVVPGRNLEQDLKTEIGRLKAANTRIKELEDAKIAREQEELATQGKYKELHEAGQSKISELEAYKTATEKEVESLRSFQEKQIEDSISRALDGVPEEEKKSLIEDTVGMKHEARLRHMERIKKSYNKKPGNTVITNGLAGDSKDPKTNLLSMLQSKIKQ